MSEPPYDPVPPAPTWPPTPPPGGAAGPPMQPPPPGFPPAPPPAWGVAPSGWPATPPHSAPLYPTQPFEPIREPVASEPRRSFAHRLGVASMTVGVVALLGVPAAFVWDWLAPRVAYRITEPGSAAPIDYPSKAFVAADGYFFFLTLVAGLVTGVIVWLLARRNGVVTAVALAAGGLAAAVIAWRLGVVLGDGNFNHLLATKPVGTRINDSLQLRARGALVAWPIAALFSFVIVTAYRGTGEAAESPAPDGFSPQGYPPATGPWG